MQSIVIGASGIVGGLIVKQLVQAGQKPLALSRAPYRSCDVDWRQGDLMNASVICLPPVDMLFCTAEVGLLAQALPSIDTTSLKRVVAFTSTSIVTKIESEIPAEREFLQRLAEGEQKLIAVCERLGIGWTILRPTIIYAEGRDGNVSRLARFIQRFGFFPLMGQGGGLRQPVHAEDLAVGAIAAANSLTAANKVYSVPGGETISYREMVGRIFDSLGKPRRIIPVPRLIWEVAFAAAKPFFPNTNVAMGRRMAKDMVFDPAPAVQDFGWQTRTFHPRFP